jgi:hypothetical protein
MTGIRGRSASRPDRTETLARDEKIRMHHRGSAGLASPSDLSIF